jgi:hypothetical protein
VSVTGAENCVPCGVSANVSPALVMPAGNGGAPCELCATATDVFVDKAPAGTTTCEPFGPVAVPPAGPMPEGGGEPGFPPASPPPPPQAVNDKMATRIHTKLFIVVSGKSVEIGGAAAGRRIVRAILVGRRHEERRRVAAQGERASQESAAEVIVGIGIRRLDVTRLQPAVVDG